ncbi:MAG: type II toxin-antitoxin system RelE/ParE family toxin, partial [bacterium]
SGDRDRIMKWHIEISKASQKFIKKNGIRDDEIISHLRRAIYKLQGKEGKVDLKKMKGDWKDFFRIRTGKMRIIFKTDFDHRKIFVDRIDFRGDVYK